MTMVYKEIDGKVFGHILKSGTPFLYSIPYSVVYRLPGDVFVFKRRLWRAEKEGILKMKEEAEELFVVSILDNCFLDYRISPGPVMDQVFTTEKVWVLRVLPKRGSGLPQGWLEFGPDTLLSALYNAWWNAGTP